MQGGYQRISVCWRETITALCLRFHLITELSCIS
jgi:hypothetical protein